MKKLLVAFVAFGIVLSFLSSSVFADTVDPFGKVCSTDAQANTESAVCKDKNIDGKNPIYGPDGFLTKVINLLSFIVGIAAVIGVMLAGLKFITAGDNPQEVAKARSIIIMAAIGLVIAASAQIIVRVFLYQVGG